MNTLSRLKNIDRTLIQKGIGAALIFSGLVLLVLKVVSIPEAYRGWQTWAAPSSGTTLFLFATAIELILLLARFALGYITYHGKKIGVSAFYFFAAFVAVSGILGLILAIASIVIRRSSKTDDHNK